MEIKKIVLDSLRFPYSDLKRFTSLAVLILISTNLNVSIYSISYLKSSFSSVNIIIGLSVIIEFIIGLLVIGYLFKIVKSSLNSEIKLPKFDAWSNLFINGIKVFVVTIFYLIPVIVVILIYFILFPSHSNIILKIAEFYPSNVTQMVFYIARQALNGTWGIIVIFYILLIYPILSIAIAHMARQNSKLIAAFKLREIINKIVTIGWKNFFIWYITIGLVYLLIYAVGGIVLIALIASSEVLIQHEFIVKVPIFELLYLLTIAPFLMIYFNRALALFYKQEII